MKALGCALGVLIRGREWSMDVRFLADRRSPSIPGDCYPVGTEAECRLAVVKGIWAKK